MSGSNSILFDIDSIVDMEMTAIKYVANEWGYTVQNSDDFISDNDELKNKFKRIFGPSLFESSLNKPYMGNNLMERVLSRDQKEIFESNYVSLTDLVALLRAYKEAGGGLIKTTIRCDNEFQQRFISTLDRDIPTIVQPRKEVDTSRYGRIIVGNCIKALEYELNEPKSIVVANFIENFDKVDALQLYQLRSEFILAFGDIHSITIADAYRLDDIKG